MKKHSFVYMVPNLASIFCLLAFSNVYANDSTARVGVGGITFLKSEDIRMVQEILEISTSQVRVQYRFQNESDKPIQATVAFPMPPYSWNSGEHATEANMGPLKNFITQVDGLTINSKIDRRAIIGKVDVTQRLRKIGLSDTQIFETFAHCPDDDTDKKFELCGLNKAQKIALEKLGDWKIEETALWAYEFPPHKEVNVSHEYPPFVGESYSVPIQRGREIHDPLAYIDTIDACLDVGTKNLIRKKVNSMVAHGRKNVSVSVREVEYVLGTGKNWKGPIKDFKLRIKKSSPDEIVSLCFPGKPKREGNTILEFSQKNLTPQDKLIVFFYNIYGS